MDVCVQFLGMRRGSLELLLWLLLLLLLLGLNGAKGKYTTQAVEDAG